MHSLVTYSAVETCAPSSLATCQYPNIVVYCSRGTANELVAKNFDVQPPPIGSEIASSSGSALFVLCVVARTDSQQLMPVRVVLTSAASTVAVSLRGLAVAWLLGC